MTSQSINLDLIPNGVPPMLSVSQYDKGQTWNFHVFAQNVPFSIPGGCTVTILGTKPDVTGFQYPCTYSGNVVSFTEEQQITVVKGDVRAEIRITNGNDELIGSVNFIIRVEPAALADETIISETELPLIEQALEDLPLVEQYKKDAEAWANGTRNGVPVSSSDPTYEKNARYYAEHFIGYVTDAQWTALTALYS